MCRQMIVATNGILAIKIKHKPSNMISVKIAGIAASTSIVQAAAVADAEPSCRPGIEIRAQLIDSPNSICVVNGKVMTTQMIA